VLVIVLQDYPDFLPGQTYVLADGSSVRSARFLLRSLTIGHQRIPNVPASIGSVASTPLLGQSFLKRLGTWSVDNQREVLVVKSLAPPAKGGPAAGMTVPRTGGTPKSAEQRQALVVSPLRLSSQVAHVGQRLTVELEATNTSKRVGRGVIMLNYVEHLVSFIALHTTGQEPRVQLPTSQSDASASGKPSYQLLWSHWPVWTPGERRTAIISMVPRLPQDITLHISVVLENTAGQKRLDAGALWCAYHFRPKYWKTAIRYATRPPTSSDASTHPGCYGQVSQTPMVFRLVLESLVCSGGTGTCYGVRGSLEHGPCNNGALSACSASAAGVH
jgi:hypothetical protein